MNKIKKRIGYEVLCLFVMVLAWMMGGWRYKRITYPFIVEKLEPEVAHHYFITWIILRGAFSKYCGWVR